MSSPKDLRLSKTRIPSHRARLILLLSLLASPAARAQPALYFSFPIVPSTNWVSYSVPLVETAWTVGSPTGPPATQAQFQSALASLRTLEIEFFGSTWVFLDNPSLGGLAWSTFDPCGDDGWASGLGVTCIDGNPPPSIDAFGTPGFEAPGRFGGDRAAAYRRNLTFDAKTKNAVFTNGVAVLVPTPDAAAAAPFTPFEWGFYDFGLGAVPAGVTNVAQVSAGSQHVLALGKNGTVTGWGDNSAGQLNIPAGLSDVVAVAAGAGHSLALKADGTVVAWGPNTYGQTTVPAGLKNAVAIAGGYNYSLALRSDGTVIGWGTGYSGGVTNPVPGLSNAVSITAQMSVNAIPGGTNYCLRRDGSILGWAAKYAYGSNSFSFVTNTTWTNLTEVATGGGSFLAVRADGTVLAGYNQTIVPTGLSNVVAVAGAGSSFSLALRADGTVVGWGDNTYNQTNIPAGLTNVQAISANGAQGLALLGTGPPVQQAPLVSPYCAGGSFSVSVPSQNGRVYALEYKNSLADTAWTGLPLVAGTGATLVLNDPNATTSQRFYRVRRW
jgi:hypothetical protein